MRKLTDLCDALRTHADLLAQSHSEEWSDTPSPIDEPVRVMLTRGAEIVRGAVDLGISENPTVLGIVGRQFLELYISLHWVISSPDRAQRYMEFAKDELRRVAMLQMKAGLLSVRSSIDNKDQTEDFLKSREKPSHGVKIEQQANESGILDIYTVFYRAMSLDLHGKSETVTEPKERSELTLVHLEAIGAISQVFGHTAILWLMHRKRTSNESIREMLGLNESAA